VTGGATLPQGQRKTKIVSTIGPATRSESQLRALLQAGVDVIRLNFSHGTQEEHGQVITHVRHLATELGFPVAILQDLAGPKVRIGSFASEPIQLHMGDPFTLTTRPITGNHREVSVSYPLLPREVKPGDALLLADGAVEMEVQTVTAEDIHCRVTSGGRLSAHKGVNCPSGLFGLPILGEKDLRDLHFGIAQDVDYVGLSFVRTAADVQAAKVEIARHDRHIPIIAKIETKAALAHFDDILAIADGIMIARGDLGIETPFAQVPVVQKQLIAKANQQAKPVITATHLLRSMVEYPRPTRAEVTDVANAVIDGSDALMLSEETAVGQHPVRTVATMAAVAIETERARLQVATTAETETGRPAFEAEAIAQAACQIATQMGIDAIITVTLSGFTARLVAKYRPSQPILAATPRPDTYRRLALVRGVAPLLLPAEPETRDGMITTTRAVLGEHGWQGKKAIIVSSSSNEQNVLTTVVL
jgi:pyruvate kinase